MSRILTVSAPLKFIVLIALVIVTLQLILLARNTNNHSEHTQTSRNAASVDLRDIKVADPHQSLAETNREGHEIGIRNDFKEEYEGPFKCTGFKTRRDVVEGRRKLYIHKEDRTRLVLFKWRIPEFVDDHKVLLSGGAHCSYPPELVPYFQRVRERFAPDQAEWPMGWAPCGLFQDREVGQCKLSSDIMPNGRLLQYEKHSNFTRFRDADIIFVTYPYQFPPEGHTRSAPFVDLLLMPPRLAHQRMVTIFHGEPLAMYPLTSMPSYMLQFDLQLGEPRTLSDLYMPGLLQQPDYRKWRADYDSFVGKQVKKRDDVNVVWIASNCQAENGRTQYVQELMQHIEVHSYGKCLNNIQPPKADGDEHYFKRDWEKEKMQIMAPYKFVIAFENSNCDSYVSEKIFDAYKVGAIPLYMGTHDVEMFVPHDSYIHVTENQFQDPRELAKMIKRIVADPKLYESYFAWTRGDFKMPHIDEAFQHKQVPQSCAIASRIQWV